MSKLRQFSKTMLAACDNITVFIACKVVNALRKLSTNQIEVIMTPPPTQQRPTLPPSGTPQPPPLSGQGIAPTGAFPGSLTPGWNDPPPLSADITANDSTRRPRLDLRKRVAYPMSGNQGSTQPPPLL